MRIKTVARDAISVAIALELGGVPGPFFDAMDVFLVTQTVVVRGIEIYVDRRSRGRKRKQPNSLTARKQQSGKHPKPHRDVEAVCKSIPITVLHY